MCGLGIEESRCSRQNYQWIRALMLSSDESKASAAIVAARQSRHTDGARQGKRLRSMRFLAFIIPITSISSISSITSIGHGSRNKGEPVLQPNQKVACFCSLTIIAALLIVPTLRLVLPQPDGTVFNLESAAVLSSSTATFTAEEIRQKATPVLTRLAPGHDEVAVSAAVSAYGDGSTQRQWCITCYSTRPGNAEAEAETGGTAKASHSVRLAVAYYDAGTGDLIRASTTGGMKGRNGRSFVPGVSGEALVRELTAPEAIQVARAWLPKLGFDATDGSGAPAPLVFPPHQTRGGFWWVWLQGRETPSGPAWTVRLSVGTVAGSLPDAVVVERAGIPEYLLPHRSSLRDPQETGE